MADPLAAALAPETLETGIRRALERTLERHAVDQARGQSTYVTIPLDHLPILSGLREADITVDWCVALDGNVHIHNDRATICTMPKGSAHVCRAMTLRSQLRPRDHSLAVAREPLVEPYLAKLDAADPTGFAADRYILGLLR